MNKIKSAIIGVTFLFLSTSICQAATITLKADGTGDYATIQAAINGAVNGDVIELQPGYYRGSGNRDITYHGKAIIIRSIAPDNSLIVESTVIDCNGISTDKHCGFIFATGEGPNSILEGLTITNGYSDQGGGIRIAGSSPQIKYCIIKDNKSIADLGFLGGSGAGIMSSYGNPIIKNCIFAGNLTLERGGGFCSSACNNENPQLINCTFYNNTALRSSGAGGALLAVGGLHTITVKNTIFWHNTSTDNVGIDAYATSKCGSPKVALDYCLLEDWQNKAHLTQVNSIVADPCFASTSDYHLKSQAGRWNPATQAWVYDSVTSLGIDTGNPGYPLDSEPDNSANSRIEIGAYGGTAEASKTPEGWALLADLNNDGIVDYKDLDIWTDNWLGSGNCIPSDLNRNSVVDLTDFALFAQGWLSQSNW